VAERNTLGEVRVFITHAACQVFYCISTVALVRFAEDYGLSPTLVSKKQIQQIFAQVLLEDDNNIHEGPVAQPLLFVPRSIRWSLTEPKIATSGPRDTCRACSILLQRGRSPGVR
jgi:hypothetical protein